MRQFTVIDIPTTSLQPSKLLPILEDLTTKFKDHVWERRWATSDEDGNNLGSRQFCLTADGIAHMVSALYPTPERIREFIDDYELRGDGGDYKPKLEEQILIEDFTHGMIWQCTEEFTPQET